MAGGVACGGGGRPSLPCIPSPFRRYGREENQATVATYSRIIYVGNIGFCTTDRQIYEFFSRAGPVERVIMGLNRLVRPCVGPPRPPSPR